MVATAQRFSEMHPAMEIVWEKRSLQEFADYPLEKLAETYDLLVIDHPFVGFAALRGGLVPLDEFLSDDFMQDQARNSVGDSHRSYFYRGHQWALAIDAAAPVSAWRPDLAEQFNLRIPETWEELLALARQRRVAFPAIPVDSLMNFYMFCCALGEPPFSAQGRVAAETGAEALASLRELVSLCRPEILDWNPIRTYEAMTLSDEIVYCPFGYGYSNYARPGYARVRLKFGDVARIGKERPATTLGGTGLAIAARCPHREAALDYARYVASAACQCTLYFASGGQPGHRSAWTSEEVNRASHNFFRDTLPALERAYLRPRYCGCLKFQDQAGAAVHRFLRQGGEPRRVITELQEFYEKSQEEGTKQ
jgi:multiple sugar transport system substrate-binding protein